MTDKEKLIKIKSLADKMSDTAFNITTNASLLKKAIDEYHQFIINEYHKEEQTIKELQEKPISNNYSALLPCIYNRTLEERVKYCKYCSATCEGRVKEPVNEDLEKAANEWDAKASFTPFYMALDDKGNPYEVKRDYTTHAESFKAGAKWHEEQMMTKAIEGTARPDDNEIWCDLKSFNFKDGDKVKVIVIKED